MLTILRRPGIWVALLLVVAAIVVGTLRARGPVVRTASPVRKDREAAPAAAAAEGAATSPTAHAVAP
jgi:UPF0716 family protein affecting phage T7 exclusion